jgi:dienelactone hydrolase
MPLLTVLWLASPAPAADPIPDATRGDHLRDAYFRRQVQQIADASLADLGGRDDWEKKRPEMRRQFLDMLGLWPLPPRTDLHATITGKIRTDAYTIETLHFQSMPGLYVTANLYVPNRLDGQAPAVLYLCGHGNVVENGVSYGSKVFYQRHPAWLASHGYVCLILDTLELGEIPGEHHGTYRKERWWWQAAGFTPAGVECWNAIRALDYLESRKEVDPKRLGVTGRSGGGATSWWVAAADQRVACAVPVAGLADLRAHVLEGVADRLKDGVITGHCDCMYPINTYRWDFPQVMALVAPRPLLVGNSDADDIFPVDGYRRMADKVRKVYDLHGAGDRFQLVETKGPHTDTPELRLGAFRWLNRWLKNDDAEVTEAEFTPLPAKILKVFDKLPDDAINPTIDETFHRPAEIEIPHSAEVARAWWEGKAPELRDALRQRCFRGWPDKSPALDAKPAEEVIHDGLRLRAYDFVSEEDVPLRLWLLTAEKVDKPTLTVLNVLNEDGMKEWAASLGPEFQTALQLAESPKRDDEMFAQNRRALAFNKWAFAAVCPRGVGPTRWSEVGRDGKSSRPHILRRFPLLGQTLDGQRVWDVRRAVAALKTIDDVKSTPLWLQGKGDMAVLALYAAVFESDVVRLDLYNPPPSHREGPVFLNVLRVLDVPQAMALVFPRQVKLYVKDDAEAKAWEWPLALQKALGGDGLQVRKTGE